MITFTWDLASPLAQAVATLRQAQGRLLRPGSGQASDGVLNLYGLARIGEKRDAEWAYSLGDALNSVRQWADGDGDVTYAAGYRPFGVVLCEEGSSDSAWGFTGEWLDAYIDLLYLRARWYEPESGRFISPDTIMPDFRNPQSINHYLYALANPLRYTDPSGHSPPGTCCAQGGCDPDDEAATRWLVGAMRTNAVSPEARTIRSLNRLALAGVSVPVSFLLPSIPLLPPFIAVPCPLLSIPPKALAYIMWIEMVRTRAPWDFKDPVRERWPGFEWGGWNIRVCCDWYWYEAVANIHYGYVGRGAGFTSLELKAGAGAAQYQEYRNAQWYRERIAEGEVGWHTYYDEPEDQAGIQIGLDLYNEGISLTPEKFCEVFDRWAPQLKAANWYDGAPWI